MLERMRLIVRAHQIHRKQMRFGGAECERPIFIFQLEWDNLKWNSPILN